jgi:hypothetical protein
MLWALCCVRQSGAVSPECAWRGRSEQSVWEWCCGFLGLQRRGMCGSWCACVHGRVHATADISLPCLLAVALSGPWLRHEQDCTILCWITPLCLRAPKRVPVLAAVEARINWHLVDCRVQLRVCVLTTRLPMAAIVQFSCPQQPCCVSTAELPCLCLRHASLLLASGDCHRSQNATCACYCAALRVVCARTGRASPVSLA